jgi:apolipoprotein N-acyltransferase
MNRGRIVPAASAPVRAVYRVFLANYSRDERDKCGEWGLLLADTRASSIPSMRQALRRLYMLRGFMSNSPFHVRLRKVFALAAGALLACAFAPLGWWPLAILCPAVLMYLWQGATPREAAWLGFWFNVGTFAAGTYWLYVSIHVFGGAPIWLALVIMAALVAIMGLYHALLGYAVARWLPKEGMLRGLVGLPAAWLLIEWWRGWFLSGFSWLSLGYSQTDTWLANLAPVVGVYGLSAILLTSAGALVALLSSKRRLMPILVLVVPWTLAASLSRIEWTQPSGQPVTVAIVQGAVPQDLKWDDASEARILELYRDLALEAAGSRLIVWPEAALPDIANKYVDYLRDLYFKTHAQGSTLMLGTLRASDDMQHYYNAVLAMDDGKVGWYDKHHLVPFAEFFPVPGFVRSWLRLRNLPYADFTRGAAEQLPLSAAGLKLATTICYEDAYGSSMRKALREADALVNVTNDAWFGRSTARHQHLQIARLRAIEAGRYMIRAANDGISAVIGPRGEIVARAPEFEPAVLRAEVTPRTGLPPYFFLGNWLIVSVAALGLAIAVARRNL